MNTTFWNVGLVGHTNASGGFIKVYNPALAKPTSFTSQGVDARTDGAPLRSAGGNETSSTQYEGIWIGTLNGGYTLGGTVRIYGYRN
jgi:hypothetical protein